MDVREKLLEAAEVLNHYRNRHYNESSATEEYKLAQAINDVLPTLAQVIFHGVTVQEWISVKDRLPEDIDTYLVVVKYKYDFEKDFNYATDVATYNPYENAYIDDCWCTFNDWDEGQQYLHITHWMPLPQPPKGE